MACRRFVQDVPMTLQPAHKQMFGLHVHRLPHALVLDTCTHCRQLRCADKLYKDVAHTPAYNVKHSIAPKGYNTVGVHSGVQTTYMTKASEQDHFK